MTRKHSYLVGAALAVVAIVVAVLLSLRGKRDDCSAALPEDATLVGRVNLKDLMLENGLSLSDLKDFVFSPGDSGVDFAQTAYVFAFQSYFGAVIPLDDKDDFLNKTAPYHGEVERQRGLSWTTLEGSFLLVADDDKAMLVGPATLSEQDALRNTLYNCMTKGGGGASGELFASLEGRKEPVAFATTMGVIPEQYCEWIRNTIPEGVAPEDLTLCAGLSARKNRLSLSASLLADGRKAGKFLDELNAVVKPIDASLFATATPHAFLHLETGIRGEALITLLRKNPETRTKMLGVNMIFDLDMILKSIDGDVSLTLPAFEPFDQSVLVQANITDDKFMENVSSWNEGASENAGVQFLPARNDCYLCAYQNMVCYFGVRDKRLFLSNKERYTLAQIDAMVKAPEEAKGKRVYAVVDVSRLTDMLFFLPEGLKTLQRLTLACQDVNEWTLTLEADEDADILKSLIK